MAEHGVRLLELRERLDELPADRKAQIDDFDERLAEIADRDEFLINKSLAVKQRPEQLGDIDLEDALTFVSSLGLGD